MTAHQLANELEKPGTVEWKHLREAAALLRSMAFELDMLKLKKSFNSFDSYE